MKRLLFMLLFNIVLMCFGQTFNVHSAPKIINDSLMISIDEWNEIAGKESILVKCDGIEEPMQFHSYYILKNNVFCTRYKLAVGQLLYEKTEVKVYVQIFQMLRNSVDIYE